MELLTGEAHDKIVEVLWRGGVSFQWLFRDGDKFVAQFPYADSWNVDKMYKVPGITVGMVAGMITVGMVAGMSGHTCVWFKLNSEEKECTESKSESHTITPNRG